MKRKIFSYLLQAIAVIISVIFFYLTLRKVNFKNWIDNFKNIEWGWFTGMLVVAYLSHYLRALKWTIFINSNERTKAMTGVLYGYTFNFVLPRLGEIMRVTYFSSVTKFPVDYLIGTVIFERAVDTLFLALFVIASLSSYDVYGIISSFTGLHQSEIIQKHLKDALFIALLLAIGVLIFLISKKIKIPYIKGLVSGLNALSSLPLKDRISFFLLTLMMWIAYFLTLSMGIFAVYGSFSFSLKELLLIFVISSLAIVMPSQGGLGTFHFFVSKGIAFLRPEIPEDTHIFAATFIHTSGALLILLLTVFFISLNFLKRKDEHGLH